MVNSVSMGRYKSAYRPVASASPAKETPMQDRSLLNTAKAVSDQRGYGVDHGFDEYYYRKMINKQRMAINASQTHGQSKALNKFYSNMGGVFNSKAMSNMYGLYQDGEETMVESIPTMPHKMVKGHHIYNNIVGDLGILQDAQRYGDTVVLVTQDGRRISTKGDAPGWSVLQDVSQPVAASSAQGPAMFKEEIDETKKNNPKLQGGDQLQSQVRQGIEVELEHKDTIKKIEEKDPDVKTAASWIAKDHLNEMPDYYTKLKKMESQDNDEDDEDDEDDDDEGSELDYNGPEYADDYVPNPFGDNYAPLKQAQPLKKPITKGNPYGAMAHPMGSSLAHDIGGAQGTAGFTNPLHEFAKKQNIAPGSLVAAYPHGESPHVTGKMPVYDQLKKTGASFHATYTGKEYSRGPQGVTKPFEIDKNLESKGPKFAKDLYHGKQTQYFEHEIGGKKLHIAVTPPGRTDKDLDVNTMREKGVKVETPEIDDIQEYKKFHGEMKTDLGNLQAEELKTPGKHTEKISKLSEDIAGYDKFFAHIEKNPIRNTSTTLPSHKENSYETQVGMRNAENVEVRKASVEGIKKEAENVGENVNNYVGAHLAMVGPHAESQKNLESAKEFMKMSKGTKQEEAGLSQLKKAADYENRLGNVAGKGQGMAKVLGHPEGTGIREIRPDFKSREDKGNFFRGLSSPGSTPGAAVEREFQNKVRVSERITSPGTGSSSGKIEHKVDKEGNFINKEPEDIKPSEYTPEHVFDMNKHAGRVFNAKHEVTIYYADEKGGITHHEKTDIKHFPAVFGRNLEKYGEPFTTIASGNFGGSAKKGEGSDAYKHKVGAHTVHDVTRRGMEQGPGSSIPFKHINDEGKNVRGKAIRERDEEGNKIYEINRRIGKAGSSTDMAQGATRNVILGGKSIYGRDVSDVVKAAGMYRGGRQVNASVLEYNQKGSQMFGKEKVEKPVKEVKNADEALGAAAENIKNKGKPKEEGISLKD